jgi:ESS family glutamate:Na+ symporter
MFETTDLFPGGQTFGLSVSTLGFVWACIPGVWYLNYLQKKNQLKRVYEDSVTEGSTTIVEGTGEIPLVESVDKLTIQVAFVFLSYLLTFLIMFGVTELIKISNNKFLIDNVVPLIWGFNFLFGIFTTMLVKRVLILLRKKKIMKRVYTNDYMLNRIAGVAFDIMIISSIIAIDVKMLSSWQLILALVIISTVGGVLTLLYIRFATKKLYPQYQHEGMVSMYGMLTGTASTGIALLREIDPKFETPAAENLVTGSGSAALLGAPLLLIISVAKTSNYLYLFIALGLMTVFFVLYNFLMFGIKRKA